MSVISSWMRYFGLMPPRPLFDADLPDEPQAWPPVLTSVPSARPEISGSQLRGLPPRSGRPGVGGPAAPVSPGAAGIHPSQWSGSDVHAALSDAYRGDLAALREMLAEIHAITAAGIGLIDATDPTPGGLAGR